MRLLHLSNSFYPQLTGGTEIFVHQLIEAQRVLQPHAAICWAAHAEQSDSLLQSLSPVQHQMPPVVVGSRQDQAAATAAAIPGFEQLLVAFRPDVLHLHSFSASCGLSHVRAARAAGVRVVVTVHAPGFSCIKGNLIDASGAICDGVLRERRCTRCRLHNGHLPRWLAGAIALQDGWPFSPEAAGRWLHALTARRLTRCFQQAWLELADQADAIHVLAAWSRDVLLRQGISAQKVHLIRTAGPPLLPPRERTPMQDGLLRLVYWGRCHPVKGLHLVIQAIQRLPLEAPIQLDCYGPYWDGDYGQQLLRQIAGDPRIRVLGSMSKDALLPLLQAYDLAVVPSTWLETGPLTVLEAFAAGLPVMGSNLGGIQELLSGVPGCTLLPLEVEAWVARLNQVLDNPNLLSAFVSPLGRGFQDLARELLRVYR